MVSLKNKIVFITGASSGIGMACAEAFAKEGANLIISARRVGVVENNAQYLSSTYNVKVLPLALDVRNAVMVKEVVSSLPQEWSQIDILINNAGLARGLNKLYDDTVEGIDDVIDTNLKGAIFVTREIVKKMVVSNKGHVINIGSIAGHEAYPGGAVYCASKHALNAVTKSLRMDLLGTKVRVTTIDPGLVETNFSMIRFNGDAEKAKSVYKGLTPLLAHDIAETVVFAASRPEHVVIAEMVVFPVAQASATMVCRLP